MKKYIFLFVIIASLFSGCAKDDIIEDFVEPTLRITNLPDTIELNTTFQFEYIFLNNIGAQEDVEVIWSSSDPSIIEIDNSGLATAIAVGSADISVEYENNDLQLVEKANVNVGNTTTIIDQDKSGVIRTTTFYTLEGSFTLKEDGNNLLLEIANDYKASSNLPGLYLYLTNNRNSIRDAYEVSAVEIFSGAHSYTIENVGINDFNFLLYFCKPFVVKVGDAEII